MAIGSLYRPFIELAHKEGVELGPILERLGLSAAEVTDPAVRIAPRHGRALASALVEEIGDPEIGLRAADRFRTTDVDLLGYLMRHAADPLGALELLKRYATLLGDTADITLRREGPNVAVVVGRTGGRAYMLEGGDYAAGVVMRIVDDLSGGKVRPVEVRLQRPAPRRTSSYRRFFGVPVVFGAEQVTVVYVEAALRAPLHEHDPRLLTILCEHADDALATVSSPDPLHESVRLAIVRQLASGNVSVHGVARRMGLSERTLRRRLAQGGQSYRALLDDARRQRALSLLDENGCKVTQTAQLLGFGDATSFARAFRRWTGSTPQAYRRRPR